MYVIVWEFRVKPAQQDQFRRAYGSNGDWIRLFQRSAGYLGSELLADESDDLRFLTLDRWCSRAAYDAFRAAWQDDYHALDRVCETLTEHESEIGAFTVGDD
jgi:quinol monooxygenase YgiN